MDNWTSKSCQLDSELDFIYAFLFCLVPGGFQSQKILAAYFVTYIFLSAVSFCAYCERNEVSVSERAEQALPD